jgi:hypothetical protein
MPLKLFDNDAFKYLVVDGRARLKNGKRGSLFFKAGSSKKFSETRVRAQRVELRFYL